MKPFQDTAFFNCFQKQILWHHHALELGLIMSLWKLYSCTPPNMYHLSGNCEVAVKSSRSMKFDLVVDFLFFRDDEFI